MNIRIKKTGVRGELIAGPFIHNITPPIKNGSVMENKRKNRKEFVHIGSIVNKVFKAARNDADADMIQVWNVWKGVVGSAVAENARPAAFKGNLLLVNVSSSPWLQQLQFLKGDLIIKLNQALKQELVTEIKFKIGPLE